MAWKLAANISLLFTEVALLERVGAAARAGFDGVEIQFPYAVPARELRDELQHQEMPLVLFNLPAGDLLQGGPGLAGVPGGEAEFAAALQLALEYAQILQPTRVNVLPGRLVASWQREQALQTLESNLALAADAFAELGIGVVCEAINRLDMPDFLLAGSAELAATLARIEHPNLSAQLDFYHMAQMGEALPESIQRLAGRIGHVQFADQPGRGMPGSGQMDYSAALAALAATGYNGWLAAEYRTSSANDFAWMQRWRASGWIAERRAV
ncbi:MAG: TIM barrel protein [Halopseudomonas sp.]|uniref:hydroxypyruvate isomerase family protein n=1 Tax=Halopseudomonas sp. TaxID=2901191 RepID=UPI0030027DFD